MSIIGVTGSFGTGKTTVSGIFKRLGAKVIDADKLVHSQLRRNEILKKIISQFGSGILTKRKKIDRFKLAKVVFKDKKKLNTLIKIIHPVVISRIKSEIRKSKNEFIVIDAPLLIESGLDRLVDYIVVVCLPRVEQIRRLKNKYNFTTPEILRRIRMQIPLKYKKEKADFIINNEGTFSQTERKVRKICQQIIK